MTVLIREAGPGDLPHLKHALYVSVVWDSTDPPPIDQVVGHPDLKIYWEGWGRHGDLGVVAEEGTRFVGAAFGRLFRADRPSYGFVDEQTPEVGIGIVASHRGKGLGRRMMNALEDAYERIGSSRLSLSVNLDNPARHLYESLGYHEMDRDDASARMVKDLA